MVAIKGLKMPRHCNECKLHRLGSYDPDLFCIITGDNVDDMMEHRHKNCPLVETDDKE